MSEIGYGFPLVIPAGLVVQIVNFQTGAYASGSTVIPNDNTIPQITEGDEYMTLAITPKKSENKLKIDVVLFLDSNTVTIQVVALFQDAIANALAVGFTNLSADDNPSSVVFSHYMTAGTTSAITFRVRAGQSSGALAINGLTTGGLYGGALASSITITEIAA